MKTFVAIAALVAAAGVHANSSPEGVSASSVHAALRAKWSTYKAKHGKQYAAHVDSAKLAVFLANTRIIEEHNERYYQGLETSEMEHNELSDLTPEEIEAKYMGLKSTINDEINANASVHVTSGSSHPDKFDWRDQGAVTSVRAQGGCASCYSFAAVGALETAHWRKHNQLVEISEQHYVDCTRQAGNNGCGGGTMHACYRWLARNEGYIALKDYKYITAVGVCQDSKKAKIGKLEKHVMIPAGDESALLDAVATTGTVAVAIWNRFPQYHYYRQGVIDIPNCPKERATHAVVIVGYGNENGVDFWAIKNSYGAGWGDKGYFKMRRGVNLCGIANWAVYPVVA